MEKQTYRQTDRQTDKVLYCVQEDSRVIVFLPVLCDAPTGSPPAS